MKYQKESKKILAQIKRANREAHDLDAVSSQSFQMDSNNLRWRVMLNSKFQTIQDIKNGDLFNNELKAFHQLCADP